MQKGDRVFIATLHPGEHSAMYHESLMALMAHESARADGSRIAKVVQQICGTLLIPEERNRVTRRFFESPDKPDWLLWIDADMGFAPSLIDDLLAAANPHGKAIVGALCFAWQRLGTGSMNEPFGWLSPTLYEWDEKIASFMRRREFPENELIQVDATGAACLLIHRKALEAIQQQSLAGAARSREQTETSEIHEHFVRPGNPEGYDWWTLLPCHSSRHSDPYFGEDMSFCLRARKAGIPIHVHTGIQTAHDDNRRPLTAAAYRKEQMTYPNITVIPTDGGDPGKLVQLLEDLAGQDETHSVFLADNGAPSPVLLMLQQKFDSNWLRLLDQRDSGIADTWNACLQTAWIEYGPWCNIALLRDNIRIGPRFMSALAHGLRKQANIGAVGPTHETGLQRFGLGLVEDVARSDDQVQRMLQSALMVRGELAGWYRFPRQIAEIDLPAALSRRKQSVAISYDTHVK